MTETKPRYANFPERELKVVLGPHLNATTMKALGRLTIGTYEMSVIQQERGKQTCDGARHAVNTLSKELGMKAEHLPESRDFLTAFVAANDQHEFKLWVTPPFESGQAAHLVWTKYIAKADGKVGVAFKLATAFTSDDMYVQLKKAQDNAVELPAGQPYELKGNPPPRFQKKAKPDAAPADASAPEKQ